MRPEDKPCMMEIDDSVEIDCNGSAEHCVIAQLDSLCDHADKIGFFGTTPKPEPIPEPPPFTTSSTRHTYGDGRLRSKIVIGLGHSSIDAIEISTRLPFYEWRFARACRRLLKRWAIKEAWKSA